MSLLERPIPPRPDRFGPDGAPVGVDVRLDAYSIDVGGVAWHTTRPRIRPRLIVVHTNAANVESSTESSIRWGNSSTSTTKAHYHLGDTNAKCLRSDLRGIGNATTSEAEMEHGEVDASYWSLVIETADMGRAAAEAQGVDWPHDCGPFLYDNADVLAGILAYESVVWDIPLVVPDVWNGSGVVAHTWPYGYPYLSIFRGKTCPGAQKIRALVDEVLPRARQIKAAWTEPPEVPDVADLSPYLWKHHAEPGAFLVDRTGVLYLSADMAARVGDLPMLVDDSPGADRARTQFLALTGLTAADFTGD